MTLESANEVRAVEAWLRDSDSTAVRLAALRKLETTEQGASPLLLEDLVLRSPLAGEAGVPAIAAFVSLARHSDPAVSQSALRLAEAESDPARKSILSELLSRR